MHQTYNDERKETGMDYNYVRMRNELKNGDMTKAEECRLLYEGKKRERRLISRVDCVIIMLLTVSLILGMYILHSEQRASQPQNDLQLKTVSEVQK